ncbi:unnamed protein product [Caenorhabditis auriculariae]|uniref:Uncharacterized protein n=1 Tax=Caenorhabditis auriculariae TaxID=2777116 RepID=A0A8S1HTL9_9PELO|nr:unnamed protein product [Caenorhabditis auriculariae]
MVKLLVKTFVRSNCDQKFPESPNPGQGVINKIESYLTNNSKPISEKGAKNFRPRQDSNLQSPDPKSGALSIRPRGP